MGLPIGITKVPPTIITVPTPWNIDILVDGAVCDGFVPEVDRPTGVGGWRRVKNASNLRRKLMSAG